MGKKKQQKQYRLNKKKGNEVADEMKIIMNQLAENKIKNVKMVERLVAITDINQVKKKIKKERKIKRLGHRGKDVENVQRLDRVNSVEEKIQLENDDGSRIGTNNDVDCRKCNIFVMDTFESGTKTIMNQPSTLTLQTADHELLLLSEVNKLMGGTLTLDKFGEKPLKLLPSSSPVHISDDQDQPNSLINITHTNLQLPTPTPIPPSFHSNPTLLQFRRTLPIYMRQQQLIQTINTHLVTLICGATGSGKSTQIGQFLLQNNYQQLGKIVITQPRRLATIALATRVAQQMNVQLGQQVGYQVRHNRKDSQTTLLKFMTDGILLNQMSSDNYLTKYGIIIIDEAHQRKINTDILIGLLSKLILIRYKMSQINHNISPLRLIIMSATMRIQDFQNKQLFNYYVPIISIESRMFPVTVYHQKHTPEDYKQAVVKKCLEIHRRLPEGDVLVFLTGKEEIHQVVIKLEQLLTNYTDNYEAEDEDEIIQGACDELGQPLQQPINQLTNQHSANFQIHMLYSSLPLQKQQNIFIPSPPHTRKFIISTNIAQTSLTIPNIRYVIDSGYQKHRYFDGIWKWKLGYGTQAMAEQRSGRAGRTTYGCCYRLYSAALYANIMEKYPQPEISKQPLENILLQLKAIGIKDVYQFPFPTIPDKDKMKAALQRLQELGAVKKEQSIIGTKEFIDKTIITELGKTLSFIPLQPRLAKMLLLGRKLKVQKYALLLVVLLTVQSIFLEEQVKPKQTQQTKQAKLQQMHRKKTIFQNRYKSFTPPGHKGDIFIPLNILCNFLYTIHHQKHSSQLSSAFNLTQSIYNYSQQHHLRYSTLLQLYYNTDQLIQIYTTLSNQHIDLTLSTTPTTQQLNILLTILIDTFINNLCRYHSKNLYHTKTNQQVHIHQYSQLYLKMNHFVCCTQFYQTTHQRCYMRYPFVVHDYELLAARGQIVPPNNFVWRNKQLVGLTIGVIYGWQIPNIVIYQLTDSLQYFFVARYLLDGHIVPTLKAFSNYLTAPISTIRPDNLDYKVQKLVEPFRIFKINNLPLLQNRFKKDITFLKEQLKPWLNVKQYDQVYIKIRDSILAQT